MTTAFTTEWLNDPQNQRLVAKANHMAKEMISKSEKRPYPFVFFQEMALLELVYSNIELIKQGWSTQAIQQYLANDAIFSFNAIDLFLAGAVTEAALAMPDCAVKRSIVINKLCQ